MCKEFPADFQRVIDFHGHVCPGLVTGYRLAKAARSALDIKDLDDADLVTIAETDRCTVDAFQVILNCTVGKGKLIIRNRGKQAFTVGDRVTNKAVRVVTQARAFNYTPEEDALTRKVMSGHASEEEYQIFKAARTKRIHELLTFPESDILSVYTVTMKFPAKEMIYNSPTCAFCGEQVMEPWVRMREGKISCLTCAYAQSPEDKE